MSLNSEILEQTFTEELYKIKPQVIVLIPEPWTQLRQEDIVLLTRILQAVNITLDSVKIITKPSLDLEELSVFLPSAVLSFGTSVKQITAPYKTFRHNEANVLVTDTLSDLDEAKKKILWTALKQMFLPTNVSDKP